MPISGFIFYLDQLSLSSNLIDGGPSTLLAIVLAAAGGIVDINPFDPKYKKLEVGHIHQLNIRILDEVGMVVKKRESPITAVFKIWENA